jgi:autotransporter-associated beta strand protein
MRIAKKFIPLFISFFEFFYADSASWIWPGGGDWNNSSNWSAPLFPNDPSDVATFGNLGEAPITVTVNADFDVASLEFASPGEYTLDLPGTLNIYTSITSDVAGANHQIDANLLLRGNLTVNLSFPLTINGVISGTNQITKQGSAALSLAGTNTYSGQTNLTAGSILLANSSGLGDGNLVMSDGTTLSLNNGITVANDIELTSSANGNIQVSSGTATINGSISGNPSTLTKIGAGRLNLTNSNLYTGGTIVKEGTLALVNDGALAIQGSVTLDASGAQFSIADSSAGLILVQDLTTASGTIFDLGAKTLTFGTDNSTTIAGQIIGVGGGIAKNGSGAVTLSGNNTYTGLTSLTNGTIVLASNTGIGGDLFMSDGTTLSLNNGITAANRIGLPISGIGNINVGLGNSATLSGQISGFGSTLTKTGAGSLSLGDVNTYDGGTIVNAGTLALTGFGSLVSTAPVTVNNSGSQFSISGLSGSGITIGDLTTASGTTVNLGAKALTLGTTNSTTIAGVISGSGGSIVKNGSGTVTLSGANTYSGGTQINAGTIIGNTSSLQGAIVNNAALEIAQVDDGTYSGALSGSGATDFNITSGKILTLSGASSSYSGTSTVDTGELKVNGSLGGTTTIGASGRVSGTGTLATVVNNGLMTPGNSIGTINITGDYTQSSSGTYLVEIEPGGTSDQIVVTGTANLDGTVELNTHPGLYSEGTVYTILSAGTINGTFASLVQPTGFTYELVYSGLDVLLQIIQSGYVLPILNSELSGNVRSVADYLFCGSGVSTNADMTTVKDALVTLSPAAYQEALSRLAPTQFSGLPLLELENNSRLIRSYSQRMQRLNEDVVSPIACVQNPIDQGAQVWLDPIAFYYSQDAQEQQTGFNAQTYGFSFGGAKKFWGSFVGGVGGSYSHSELKWKNDLGIARSNVLYLGPYIGWQKHGFYIETAMLGTVNFYDVYRNIQFANIDRTASNRHLDWNITNNLDMGMKWFIGKQGFFIEPFYEAVFVQSFQSSYNESGANSLNLDVQREFASFFRSDLELNIGQVFCAGKQTTVVADVMVGWMKTVQFSNGNYTATLLGGSDCEPNFTVQGYDTSPSQIHYGASITGEIQNRFALGVNYDGSSFGKNSVQEVRVRFQWNF